MTKTCPFCATPAKDHEAGRCLDHWIEVVKTNKIPDDKFKCENLSADKYGKFYHTFRGEKYEIHSKRRYSKDLNDAITLWPKNFNWRLQNSPIGWRILTATKVGTWDVLSCAKTPATAIGRAYLEVNYGQVS